MQLRPLFLIFDDEVRESDLESVPIFQNHRSRQATTVHMGSVRRMEVAENDIGAINRQFAMPSAKPAVIDANTGYGTAAEFNGELVNRDFARRGQRVLAKELDLHGRSKKANQAGVGGREASEMSTRQIHTLDLWMVHPPKWVSMATLEFLKKRFFGYSEVDANRSFPERR